jgi:SAM-dependent methyltransferase
MNGFYLWAYSLFPTYLKRRINPLEYSIRSFVLSARPSSTRAKVLDAGAGEARFKTYFRDHLYVALDSGVGEKDWDYSQVDIQADLSQIPAASDSMDIVLNIQVLEHVSEPFKILSELNRVLKPGGNLFLTAPQGWHEHQQPHDYFRFTRFSLAHILLGAGFESLEIQPIGGYFHYLGHRLTYIPKVLFSERSRWCRWLLFPLELASLGLFCLILPVCCYYLDFLDAKKEFTLCYQCRARKAVVSNSCSPHIQ